MHRAFRGSATSLLTKNQTKSLAHIPKFLIYLMLALLALLLPLVLVAAHSEGMNSKSLSHMVIDGIQHLLLQLAPFCLECLSSSWTGSGTGIFPFVPTLKVFSWALKKAHQSCCTIPECSPVPCSCVLLLCWVLRAWEEPTARCSPWGSSPEILQSPAHQACCCLLQEKTCLNPSSSVILRAADGFSPKYRIFSILLSPIPPTWTEPKTNWGEVFGWCALSCSVLLPAQNISSDLGCVWSGGTGAELCVCVLCQQCSAAGAVLCVRVPARVGMCVFVCLSLGA